MDNYKIHKDTKIGHVHLSVSNMDDSVHFYKEILGFEVTQVWQGATFLSAGGYHHHIGLNLWARENTRKPHEGQIGLYHFAILYPNKKEFAKAVKRIIEAGYEIDGSADHGVSKAVYLKDPDGNGIELYVDEEQNEWPIDSKGRLNMKTEYLDIEKFISDNLS